MNNIKLKILEEIEKVKKEILELDNKNIELIKKCYASYWKQIANKKEWQRPYSEYHLLQIRLKTLESLLSANSKTDAEESK